MLYVLSLWCKHVYIVYKLCDNTERSKLLTHKHTHTHIHKSNKLYTHAQIHERLKHAFKMWIYFRNESMKCVSQAGFTSVRPYVADMGIWDDGWESMFLEQSGDDMLRYIYHIQSSYIHIIYIEYDRHIAYITAIYTLPYCTIYKINSVQCAYILWS